MYMQNTGRYRSDKNETNKEDNPDNPQPVSGQREESVEFRMHTVLDNDHIDSKYGFDRVKDYVERTGFLLNMHGSEIINEDKKLIATVDFYFMEENGTRFKVSYPFKPYFYILTRRESMQEVSQFLMKKFSGAISKIEIVAKEDLDMPNHLIGLKQHYLKLMFLNQFDLIKVRREILKVIKKNKERNQANNFYANMLANVLNNEFASVESKKGFEDHMENLIDIREYDVPYHVRVSIDLKICCGSWYTVKPKGADFDPPIMTLRSDIIERPDPIVLAFDIETTKLPLKFPDSNTDQIMMISYMIDGQGYLITNREIISSDIEDFEFTPRPEFEGKFKIFNELNEMALLQKFFDHIMDIRPHIFVTYNGDFFDWPFIEARAAFYELDMKKEIGFGKTKEGIFTSRPAMHMDCFNWVKRDSYLPVGSHGLKAVAKAKLRYDPVELDPEDMCPLAASDPHALSTYSVSDAVATYYLYMQYVHPFIFALCTIIPCEPDEVLRKGSGTLCEALLMVEAFHGNIIFPNKEETIMNKLTDDGHVLHQETYVGGHVEALESGIFRADIPCRFRLVPSAIDSLIEQLPRTIAHAVVIEEGVPLEEVTNLDEVIKEITDKLLELKAQPMRLERPLIYHLDVGAMYPNIILTNRLQPCSMASETICASCDYNKPSAKCQRNMSWMWRGEYMPASRNEYHRIQQQLETEKFPPLYPGGPQRAFHQLRKDEQSNLEKQRLSVYCKKAYKKTKLTRIEERTTTVCQKENSFYVDTVRAFRDRRYEYKDLSKKAKQQVTDAIKSGDPSEIKSAKNKEVLYDSLQTAHKCILNSFYGYVMRKGARWHSMEMAGIVCYTGAHIIMRAREIVEQIGRPLELDTDGIWCMLPASFPENVTVLTTNTKKPKINVSYPNTILNYMVKDLFTNEQYHELVNSDSLEYEIKSENTIFFEVDGPYKAMVLPSSKEEGKKLKKRYAVFNFDGSLAELKGFEVKRRGELQLIKNFQSSVFEAFLKGTTLETCYAAVAQVADYWLDVLFSHGKCMPDLELFELISENRSMSRKLEDYGQQKSTSISTAKRLAEFLGDQMVKDAGLACKYIISRQPHGAPVTERAIPLAIFQAEDAIQKHFLRKWLKDPSLNEVDIRDILDWNYYIERLGGTIQKIITIPAAMQGVPNPVPRVRHPDWLHKKVLAKNDTFKQRRIDDIFSSAPKPVPKERPENMDGDDIEDFGKQRNRMLPTVATVSKRKRSDNEFEDVDIVRSWQEVLGNPPPIGTTREERLAWLQFHKKKWRYQALQRNNGQAFNKKRTKTNMAAVVRTGQSNLGGFLQKAQRSLIVNNWQIVQISVTGQPGEYRLWALVQTELHLVKLIIPRIFYANLRTPKCADEGALFQKCNRTLPRSRPTFHVYQYTVPEELFQEHGKKIYVDQTEPDVEGVYETQMPPLFRALVQIGCVCKVARGNTNNSDTFNLNELEMGSVARQPYLPKDSLRHIYLYQHRANVGARQMFGVYLTPLQKALIIVVDSVRTNLMPNLHNLYQAERIVKVERNPDEDLLPPNAISFEIRVETDLQQVYKIIQKALKSYKDEKKGPTLLAIQSIDEIHNLLNRMPALHEFPMTQIHVQDVEDLYNNLEWQKIGARAMIRHYLNSERILELMAEQSRYFHLPIGNMPADPALFGADLFFARHLVKQNHVLWCSPFDKPDLGGSQENNARLLAESQEGSSEVCNNPGWYSSACIELDIDSLAINTLLQSHHVTDIEGTSSATAFDAATTKSIDDMVSSNAPLTTYDETARCAEAFKILRSMASAWMRDISMYRNVFADFQVIHFYRWLRSSKALLFDPALLRTLQNLMKKLFIQLVAEFKRLGCTIVYANFNKIIVCSKKRRLEDAIANIEFVVASIRNKELFHSLEITYRQCWEQLVWLDIANYAGIQGKLPQDEQEDEAEIDDLVDRDDDNTKVEDNGPLVVMNWNIAEQLPEESQCRDSFNTIIAGYINAIYVKLKEMDGDTTQIVALSQPHIGLVSHEDVAEFAKELINTDISQNLFHIVERIHVKFSKVNESAPALIFINSICHIFSLDPSVEEAVRHLKSNLLRLIGVGEFSDLTIWKDNTVSYIIPQLICKTCNHCRDIDLGRDNHRSEHAWLCPLCNTPYDNHEIESLLLDTVSKRFLAYNLQDLQCKKCNQIKMENLLKHCPCAGEYRCILSKNELVSLLQKFAHLSDTFDMPALKQTIDQLLIYIN